MRHCVKRTLCVLVSLSVLLTLISVFTLSTTASSSSTSPSISVGDKFIIVQTATGEIWGWGDNSNSVLGNARDEKTGNTNIPTPTEIKLPNMVTSQVISAGANHVLAIGSDGNVYAWGNNEYGQLGINNGGTSLATPTLVEGLKNNDIAAISAGRYFSLILTKGGKVYSFGRNDLLQLGYAFEGGATYSATLTLISSLENVFITKIHAGYDSATAIDSNGKVYFWGSTNNAVLGTDLTYSCQLPSLHPDVNKTVQSVAIGVNHSTFLLNDGTVGFFGINKYGQYGNGATNANPSLAFKIANTSGLNVTDIAVSNQQTVILTANGKVYTAGTRIPNDTTSASNTFVSLFSDTKQAPVAGAIDAGYQNGAMIAQDGSVWTWGDNSCCQLGKGISDEASATPVKVMQKEDSAFDSGNLPFVKDVPMVFKTTVPAPSYAVIIPSSINVGELRETDADANDRYAIKEGFTIEVKNVTNFFDEKAIVVSVEPGEGDSFYLDDGNGTHLPFDILTSANSQTPIQSGGVLARFTQDDSAQTWIRVDQSLITKSGVYNGVLTFRYSIVDIEN